MVIIAVVSFKLFNLGDYLTLSFIKESQDRLQVMYLNQRLQFIAAYMLIYILATALSLPGAVVLTLAGGALFGLWTGTLIVSFASATGATVSCFVSRFILRDWVQAKFGSRLAAVNKGIENEGAFYLFTLRLIPVFPYFLINLLLGLTKMSLSTFYCVSQIGMLPGTIVYVNAGRELGRINSLRGLLSPGLIISFMVIGILPVSAKKLLAWYKAKRKNAAT